MKKIIAILLLITLVGMIISMVSCAVTPAGGPVSATEPPVGSVPTETLIPTVGVEQPQYQGDILFWSWAEYDFEADAVKNMVDAFNAANPDVKVDLNLIRR